MPEIPDISAVILAGGKSRRLGTDKALLRVNDKWLLQEIVQLLTTLSDDLIIVGGDKPDLARLPVRLAPDNKPGLGPLGGILSGLRVMRHRKALFVACDMPLLNLPLLRYMILLSGGFDVVVPRIGSEAEPLHAIYSRTCTRPIEELLQSGERRIMSFFRRVRVRWVVNNEIEVFDPQHLSFFNINTAVELEQAESIIKKRAAHSTVD